MQVAGIRRLGAQVEMIEVGEPRPLAGDEVLLEVRAAGVANWDEFVRTGGWDVGARPPMALGVAAAGTVLAAGQGAGGWAPGDAVMTHPVPLRGQGTWAPRLIAPAALRGAEVIATAGPASQQRVAALGARHIIDYHDQDWPGQVHAITGRRGAAAAANAAPGGAASAIRAVADGGRLATITLDPPSQQRGITVSSIYVRADGNQLRNLAQQFGDRHLEIPVAASYRLIDAAQALAQATGGHAAGAIALTP